MGENMTAYVRRVRMERAAQQLRAQEMNITRIALDSGYETHSAFSKAFKGFFGVSPTEFRELNATAAAHLLKRRMPFTRKDRFMQPLEIRTLPDMKVLYARTSEVMTTPAFQRANQEAFGKLMSFLGATGSMARMKHCVAIYPDEVEVGKAVRFDAGAIFALAKNRSPVMASPIKPCPVAGGPSFNMSAPLADLAGGLSRLAPHRRYGLRDAIPFEDYIDDPSQIAPEKVRTEICIPIK